MATLNLSQLLQPVDFSDPGSVSFGTFVASAPMLWQWLTPTGNLIDVVGAGMTFSAGHATGGTVTAIGFDIGNNGVNPTEIQITGLSIAASLLDDSAESFWRILEGNDVIFGPPASATPGASDLVTFFGDNLSVRPGVIQGGDDSINMGTARAVIIGDVVDVGSDAPGAPAIAYQGGADTMNGVATNFLQTVHGDAEAVHASGALTGGNDNITLVGAALGSVVYGDAGTVRGTAGNFAAFIGGNDVIDASGCTADFISLEEMLAINHLPHSGAATTP